MLHLQTILHPTDLSRRSDHAFQLACALAEDYHARIIVLYAIEQPVTYGEMGIVVEPAGHREALRAQLEERYASRTVPVEHRLEEGSPAHVITRVAQEGHCDLIVMATHGRHGLGRLFLGSVAEQVVRQAPCPVLTIKEPLAAKAPAAELAQEMART
jgi:nucleotide-binding universal stress UspA family protein